MVRDTAFRSLGSGWYADCAVSGDRGWLIAAFDVLDGAVEVVVWSWAGRDVSRMTPIFSERLNSGYAYPRVYVWNGAPLIAYHDGIVGHLRNLDGYDPAQPEAGHRLLAPCEGSSPVCFGHGYFAWQGLASEGYPVSLMDLRTGIVADKERPGAPTGLARVNEQGTVWTIDEDRFGIPGVTNPVSAGDLTVAEGRNGGAWWRLIGSDMSEDLIGALWPGADAFTPRCAADADTLAVCTGGGAGGVRLFCGSRAELAEMTAPPVVVPPPVVVVPPVVVPPVTPPAGGSVSSETKDWSGVTVINSSQAIAGNRMTGHVSRVEIGPHGFRFWFDKQTVWPNIYPVGGGPDVGKGDPVVFTTFVFIDLGAGRIYAIAMAMDAHNQPGEGASGPPLANWDADIFYPIGDAGQFRGRWQSAKRVGFGAAAGPERLQYAGHDWPNEVNEITDVAWVPAQEGAWDLPGGVVVTPPPPPPTDPVEPPPPVVNYDARFAYIEHRVQDLLNVFDGDFRPRLAAVEARSSEGGVSEQRVIDLINDRAVLRGTTVTVQGSGKAPTFGGTVNVTSKGVL